MKVLSGTAHPGLAEAICSCLGVELGNAQVSKFPDGELDIKIRDDVRGADVFLVQPTCRPQNETLMELLMLIDSVKRASAYRVTAVIPYYGYARKDRKDEGRVPITAKLVANLITEAGADRVDEEQASHCAEQRGASQCPRRRPEQIEAEALHQQEAVIEGGDEFGRHARGDAARVGGKRYNHGLAAVLPGPADCLSKDLLVAQVYTVERAERGDGPLQIRQISIAVDYFHR